ncbi:MAG: hypothetical protein HUK02_09150 [Bacteroidaceae bacterium]|nr:hypothetical protein [Bacteroidaceae bacterium]
MARKGTYIAFDAAGMVDPICSNRHTFQQLAEWQRNYPSRFNFINMDAINFAAEHDDQTETTLKHHMLQQMAQAENLLVVASPVLNTESPILNWQISRAINRFHLPVILAYAGLETVDESTIQAYWSWLPQKFRKYLTVKPWARIAHIPLIRTKLESALAAFSAEQQTYPWDSFSIF